VAKLDKIKFSKNEIKKILSDKKLNKLRKKSIEQSEKSNSSQKNILLLKHGKKYPYDYVNKMYNMITRNCSYDLKFYCLTEDQTGIREEITCIPLPTNLPVSGWWYKPYIFSKDLPIEGTILYLDLDLVITGNIDILFDYADGDYCVLRDFTRAMRPGWQKYNSSVIRFSKGQLDYVWDKFRRSSQHYMRQFFGDQDLLYDLTQGTATYWPDKWIMSWKWEIRKDKQWKPGGVKGNRTFNTIEHCEPPKECCIVVFHGDPNPHNCYDPYIIENWL